MGKYGKQRINEKHWGYLLNNSLKPFMDLSYLHIVKIK